MGLYTAIARPLLFGLDPEVAHKLALSTGRALGWSGGLVRAMTAAHDPILRTNLAGLELNSPIGLAAGFDKSGTALPMLAGLGFGALEIGSVSVDPSGGNPRPRLFRLPRDKAIVVAYGLPNDGAEVIVDRLRHLHLPAPLGINLVKTNRGAGAPPETPDQIIAEYVEAGRRYHGVASYLMFNLSCPNTVDGRDFFADRGQLQACLQALGEAQLGLPIFLKISPLGGIATIERLLEISEPHRFVSGFMYNLPPGKPDTLTTPSPVWSKWPGAVSGKPFAPLADLCIGETYRRMDRGRYQIVGSGGVYTAEDAYRKLRLGASLVQILTALVYEGPGAVSRLTSGLPPLLHRDGLRNIHDAVGVDIH
jgi:dihydroorotate dehydrogenase